MQTAHERDFGWLVHPGRNAVQRSEEAQAAHRCAQCLPLHQHDVSSISLTDKAGRCMGRLQYMQNAADDTCPLWRTTCATHAVLKPALSRSGSPTLVTRSNLSRQGSGVAVPSSHSSSSSSASYIAIPTNYNQHSPDVYMCVDVLWFNRHHSLSHNVA